MFGSICACNRAELTQESLTNTHTNKQGSHTLRETTVASGGGSKNAAKPVGRWPCCSTRSKACRTSCTSCLLHRGSATASQAATADDLVSTAGSNRARRVRPRLLDVDAVEEQVDRAEDARDKCRTVTVASKSSSSSWLCCAAGASLTSLTPKRDDATRLEATGSAATRETWRDAVDGAVRTWCVAMRCPARGNCVGKGAVSGASGAGAGSMLGEFSVDAAAVRSTTTALLKDEDEDEDG